jgi:ferric-dicitrate binding protein FerR (iron transport regulator)
MIGLKEDFYIEELICSESFQQYCLGSSLEDQILWDEWIATIPYRKADFEEAKKIVNILNVKQGSRLNQIKELKEGIKNRNAFAEKIEFNTEVKLNPKRSYLKYTVGVAAAVLAILFLYFYLNPYSKNKADTDISELFSSGKSIRKTIVLSDGTVITLAKESTIKLDKSFDIGKRELWLTGEAFFDVKHDATHPFIVHTSFNDVSVLGTTFNVKAYPNSKITETSLIHGSVRVDSKNNPGHFVILKPNQKAIISNQPESVDLPVNKEYKVSALQNDALTKQPEETKWIRSRLDIDDLPLSVIAQKLQNWYGIEVKIEDDEVKDYRYSGTFENETIVKTLEALQLSYPFKFEIKNNKITITK